MNYTNSSSYLHVQLNLASDLGLICFCWGEENNSKETIKFLKSLNMHGIIYDKMDKLTEKNVKVRNIIYIFLYFKSLKSRCIVVIISR